MKEISIHCVIVLMILVQSISGKYYIFIYFINLSIYVFVRCISGKHFYFIVFIYLLYMNKQSELLQSCL